MGGSFMTTKEFCGRLQISSSAAYRMIKDGMIPAIKFGRRWKIPRSVFDDKDMFCASYRMMVGEMKDAR